MTGKPFATAVAAMILLVAGSAAIRPFRAPAWAEADGAAPASQQTAPQETGPQHTRSQETGPQQTGWQETRWPFLLDQWGIGRAFVCLPADCGVRMELFIRPKIGFCNCTTGVSDETELERVADTDLVSAAVRPLGPARPVRVAWMNGLARTYEVSDEASGRSPPGRLVSVAFNDECDVVVALASVGAADPDRAVAPVIAFLGTAPVVLWIKKELGLEFVHRDW